MWPLCALVTHCDDDLQVSPVSGYNHPAQAYGKACGGRGKYMDPISSKTASESLASVTARGRCG